MRAQVILRQVGFVCFLNALFMLISALVSFYYGDGAGLNLLISSIVCAAMGGAPYLFFKRVHDVNNKEGLFIVVAGWLLSCLTGVIPYLFYGGEFTFANALFESVSGFTTTGSTVLNEIESLPRGILFWRSSTHWLGGIGIIIFVLAILPQSSQIKLALYSNEVSPLAKENFRFSTKKSIRVILGVYLVLTLAQTICLFIAGMTLFDAVNHSFATVATGGFSTKNMSVAAFDSVAVETIINVFMLLSGIHFGLLYTTVLGKKTNIFTSPIVRYYVGGMVVGILLITTKLMLDHYYESWWTALRYATFQLLSVATTTGFATCDTADWPGFTQIILLFFILQCACAGSTSGGIKVNRVMILWKSMIANVRRVQHPRMVPKVKIGGTSISEEMSMGATLFIVIYLAITFLTTLLLSGMDMDLMSAFSASAATIGNVGPGFGSVSSLGNFGSVPDLGKYLLCGNMMLGRLEIFGILAIFTK